MVSLRFCDYPLLQHDGYESSRSMYGVQVRTYLDASSFSGSGMSERFIHSTDIHVGLGKW